MLSPNADPRLCVILISLVLIACGVLTAIVAAGKGYSRPLWFLAGLFVPNLLVVFLLPDLNQMHDDSKRLRWESVSDLGPFLGYCVFLFVSGVIYLLTF